ncbi:MAG: methylated-DNA--[protein]-cysteine S-methyltransferase [Candidatus Lindowbacteria bacterium]|nr:methylated-DNA--[protein]-cysteine S-methyltransferase [Candidatus Lindowbacteria bacterium]
MPSRLGTVCYGSLDSPVGVVYVAFDGEKMVALSFTSGSEADFCKEIEPLSKGSLRRSPTKVEPVVSELREYFAGRRRKFSFRANVSGFSDFQRKVLNAAARIPYGETRTYRWLAEQADSPLASRAAGQVMARNPVPIIIPCHRVIGSSGGLCGFAGGLRALDLKRRLLEIEGMTV